MLSTQECVTAPFCDAELKRRKSDPLPAAVIAPP
jgi:hypothetical protein